MTKKIQNQHLNLRITREMAKNLEKIKGKNKSDKIRKAIDAGLSKKQIDNTDYSELIDAIFKLKLELAPIGNNLNQLARFVNQGGDISDIDIEESGLFKELQTTFQKWIRVTKSITTELHKKTS